VSPAAESNGRPTNKFVYLNVWDVRRWWVPGVQWRRYTSSLFTARLGAQCAAHTHTHTHTSYWGQ